MARNNKSPYLVVMTKVGVQDKHNHARRIKMGQCRFIIYLFKVHYVCIKENGIHYRSLLKSLLLLMVENTNFENRSPRDNII